jgi:hypothetical protein
MRRLFLWVCLLALAVLFAACQRDSTLMYQYTAMGQSKDGGIVTDEGLVFHIEEQTCPGQIDTMQRVHFTCDVLRKREDKSYDIRLTALAATLAKAPLLQSKIGENPDLGEDPIDLTKAWFSGEYLNLQFRIPSDGRQTVHRVNLVWNDTAPADTVRLRFYHDDQLEEPLKDTTAWLQGIVSFETKPFQPDPGRGSYVRLEWHTPEPKSTIGVIKN